MKFRPCIDIHNGKVKQIVGGSLNDEGAKENFVSEKDAKDYADMYADDNLKGGHIIVLNKKGTKEYETSVSMAKSALMAHPGLMQFGGGVSADNAKEFIDMGASHVIVTSYAFSNGKFNEDNVRKLVDAVGNKHIVLDLSCRKKDNRYYVVTDRWQVFSDYEVTKESIEALREYCDEILVHGVDTEGTGSGMEEELVRILSSCEGIPITYAGGIGSVKQLESFRKISEGKLDFTIGSALDIFGGELPYDEIKCY